MKPKSLMLLAVAAACGLVAMIGVQKMLSGGKQDVPKVKILVAKGEIDQGVRLDQEIVGFKEWPQDAVPQGAVTKPEEFAERALKHRVGPGQPILLTELGNKGEFGLEIQIPSDMRVVSVPVTATMTHSGLLRPGNFVDVSAAIEMPAKGGGKRTVVKPVLQCIQVFAVGSKIVGSEEPTDSKATNDVKNVSFLVYPLQGQLLQLANKQSNGQLQFALRSSSDKGIANARDLNDESLSMLSNSLLGHEDDPSPVTEKAVPATAKPKSAFRSYLAPETSRAVTSVGDQAVRRKWRIEVYQGDQREIQEIDWPEEDEQPTKRTSDDSASNWSNPLLKFFGRRQKSPADNSSPMEHRATSLIRRSEENRVPELPVGTAESPKGTSTKVE